MKKYLLRFYLKAPFFLKRILANIEAVRRDYYRRFDDEVGNVRKNADAIASMHNFESELDIEKAKTLVEYTSKHVNYYKDHEIDNIITIRDYEKIPLLTKQLVRENCDELISNTIRNKKELWFGSSSGSTGTPLKYYRDKRSVSVERSSYDSYYKYCGCDLNKIRVRISGVKITEFNRSKPPYWIYIDKYKQLQCSAYHISENTYKDYLNAFEKVDANFATGFPSGWTALAEYMLDNSIVFKRFRAVITDSEALTLENQKKIEKAFDCPVYRTYGLGEVGMCAVQCKNNHYHILPSHYVEVVGPNGEVLKDGVEGEIVVTDYNSMSYPFIRYATGDLGIVYHDECGCDMRTPYLSRITGRVEDYILGKDGRKITRLTQIMKPAVGVKESQIIQNSRNKIIINVIPESNFDPKSMEKVLENAKDFVGDMEISWDEVKQLERMPSGKLKFLIRRV